MHGDVRNLYKHVVRKRESKECFEDSGTQRGDNININRKETRC